MPIASPEPRRSILRRTLLWIFGTRYTGAADASFVPSTEIAGWLGDLDPSLAGGRMIKIDTNIEVGRARWGGHDVVIKRYKHVGIIHSIRHTLKRSRGYRSWRNGRRLTELGIPTPRPLAYIDVYKGPLLWQSYAVAAYVDGPTLYHLLNDARVSDGVKRRMIRQALRLIAELGRQNIGHGDMKRTNFLCAGNVLVLTDLDAMRAHWCGWIHALRQRRDVGRFLRGLSAPQEPVGDPDTFIRYWGSCRRRVQRDFDRIDRGTCRLVVRRAFRDEQFEHVLLGKAGDLREQYHAVNVSSGQSSRVCRFSVALRGTARQVYHKQFLRRSGLDILKSLVFRSRAERALRGSVVLADHGFGTPEVVAMGETWPTWFESGGFLVTFEVAGARHLHELARDYAADRREQDLRDKRELIRSLGRMVGRLHGAGIAHGDLRPGNVLARKENSHWLFFLLDNERTRTWPWLPGRLRLKNLVQINMIQRGFLSASDRMRFFDAYLAENPSLVGARKRWVRAVARTTARRLERVNAGDARTSRDECED